MLRHLHSTSDELLHLDFLRLIASCGIVLLHFSRFLSPGTQALIGPVGGMTIFVDLFFVISGFVIAYVYMGRLNGWDDYVVFLQRRVARLAPLHWATFLVFFAIGVMIWTGRMSSDHAEYYDPRCILPNVLAVHAWGTCDQLSFNDVSWSISAEMGMYLIAPVLLLMAARSPLSLVALALVAIVFLSQLPEQPWLDWTSHFGVARALPSFALGMALMRWRQVIARMPAPREVAGVAFALFLIGVRLDWDRIVLLPIVYLIVIAAIAADVSQRYRPLKIGALGQLTYSLYMIHPLVRTFVISFAGQRILKLHGIAEDVMVLAGFALTFVLAYLSFVYFETPARRLMSRQRQRRPAGEG
jgi:peptidoglycan/LPS O-acetylase OafA/YrhL